jgi:hypothetical protein
MRDCLPDVFALWRAKDTGKDSVYAGEWEAVEELTAQKRLFLQKK